MRIGIVAQPFDVLPTMGGGSSIAIWAEELSSKLNKKNDIYMYCEGDRQQDIEMFTSRINFRRASIKKDEVIVSFVRKIDLLLKGRNSNFNKVYYKYYYSLYYYFLYIFSISKMIKADNIDIVVISNFSQFVPFIKMMNPSIKILLMMHCDWLVELPIEIARNRIEKVDAICGCSKYITESIQRRFPEIEEACYPIYNGNNLERFQYTKEVASKQRKLQQKYELYGRKVVLFVGRICPEKGVHVLIEAMRVVANNAPDAILLIVGNISSQPPSPKCVTHDEANFSELLGLESDYNTELNQRRKGLEGHVRFLGPVPHNDLPAYYYLADVFVHPAIWNEPFGMILTEAMSCALPVVSTTVGGIPEIVAHGETGLLVQPGDPCVLGQAVLELLRDKDRREEMGKRGRERVSKDFSWEATAEKLENIIYSRLTGR